ncbi:hypothetical protein LAD59_22520 [Klebsiella pneumoniae]|nr:hypothetical protein [Klebsiella pneumoniae]
MDRPLQAVNASGGGIAMLVAQDSRCCLLDEPTSAAGVLLIKSMFLAR